MEKFNQKFKPIDVLERLFIGIILMRLESEDPLELRIIYVNDAMDEIVGINMHEFVGKTYRESFPAIYETDVPYLYYEAIKTQKRVVIGEVEYGDDNVKPQTFYIAASPLPDNTALITVQNITDLKKSQNELKQKEKDLENKSVELEKLMYIVSHDLKSPINTIGGFVNHLQDHFHESKDGELIEVLEHMRETNQRMANLVEDVLEYAVIGKGDKKPEEIDINIIVQNILQDLKPLIREKNASILYRELPVIHGFKTEIRQVFQNLITNAVKFGCNKRDPIIKISHKVQNDCVEFSIKDNGIGIKQENIERIFSLFNKVNKMDDNHGSGIGLANCKKIVEMHGGKIWAESKPGKGSIFKFTIFQGKT